MSNATSNALEAIEQAMSALNQAKAALQGQGQTPTATAPQKEAPEPEVKKYSSKPLARWFTTKTGKSCLKHPSNGIVTLMPDKLHPDQICALYNINGVEGVRKFSTMPEARQEAQTMLGY